MAKPVWIRGIGSASAPANLALRDTFSGFPAVGQAARQAYDMAGIGPREHRRGRGARRFTIAEMMAYEDLGFAERGRGPELIRARKPTRKAPFR